MRTGVLARRTFTLDDQRAFAALSGDWNPLHVDPIAARRTLFDGAVVHGVHLLLAALDAALDAPASIATLRAQFKKPALVGDEVRFEAAPAASDGAFALIAHAGDQRVLDATIALAAAAAPRPPPEVARFPEEPPRLVARDDIAADRGQLALALDPALARAQLPNLLDQLGPLALAELLATTRLVGMTCPGLHSLFGGLQLAAARRDQLTLDYEIARANLKYSVVDLAVRGPTLSGSLETFYRPAPQPGPSLDDIRARVAPTEFAHQRALVVGGSRGIGEALTRCLAAGGAEVCLTYHRGAADAARVAADLDPRVRTFALDVTHPSLPLAWPFPRPPTHLYYLATPRIPALRHFSPADLDLMMRYYVTGLHTLVEATAALTPDPLHVWAPSTIFLDQAAGSIAYTVAKAAMEELGRRLPQLARVTVRMPRLPRIATDQTASLIQLEAAPALDIVLAELRAMP